MSGRAGSSRFGEELGGGWPRCLLDGRSRARWLGLLPLSQCLLLSFGPSLVALLSRRRSLADRRIEDGLRSERNEILLDGSLRHPGAIRKELVDIVLAKVGCEVTCDREADAVLGQRDEELRETSRDVRHLEPQRHRALAQVKRLTQ